MTTGTDTEQRVDAWDKVTGKAVFTEDLPSPPGTLFGAILLSPFSHARLRSISAQRAEEVPGVRAVLTREHLGGANPYRPRRGPGFSGSIPPDQPFIAIDKVRFQGDPVAAVAVDTLAIAEHALTLIGVEYEELPAVFDPRDATAPGAPILNEAHGSNLAETYSFGWGALEKGFREAQHVFEDEYVFPSLFHHPMENAGVCLAQFHGGEAILWAPIQHPFGARAEIAQLFGLDVDQVRIRMPYIGGGFGLKELETAELIALFLARQSGRPVRMVPSAEESFRTGARHSMVYRARTGVRSDGTLAVQDIELLVDAGAYLTSSPSVTERAAILSWGAYRVPHLHVQAHCIYTNRVPSSAFRSLARAQTTWGYESHLDSIARKLGIDPLEFRFKNLLRRGEQVMEGTSLMDADCADLLEKAVHAIGWDGVSRRIGGGEASPPPTGRVRGRGVSTTFRHGYTGTSASYVTATMDSHGTVRILHTAAEIGMGVYTVMARVASETLGIPLSQVKVSHPDTIHPYSGGIGSSRDTVAMGMATQRACEDLGRELVRMATLAKGGRPEEWRIAQGRVWRREEDFSFAEVVRGLGGAVVATGKGFFATPASSNPFQGVVPHWEVSVAAAEVEVDTATGEVRLLQYATAADVGKAINPLACKGQLEGGAIMGLGNTFHEETVYRDGQFLNGDPASYRLPGLGDVPERLYTLLVENGDGPGPFGAKGMGQTAVSPVAPAVGNAIYEATGARISGLPITPEKVLRALGKL